MMAFMTNNSHTGVPSQVCVWRCEACCCVHVRAGEVLLTFTPTEFTAFTESVNDCYWQQATFGVSDEPTLAEVFGINLDSEATN